MIIKLFSLCFVLLTMTGGLCNPGTDSAIPTEPTIPAICTPLKGIFVKADATGHSDGASWKTAFSRIRDAAHFAAGTPEPIRIFIAQGTYAPNNTDYPLGNGRVLALYRPTFIGGHYTSVQLEGGYEGLRECVEDLKKDNSGKVLLAEKTILTGKLAQPTLSGQTHSDHVIAIASADLAIKNLTITEGGNADTVQGGGIVALYGHPNKLVIENVIFENNQASMGGALHAYNFNTTIKASQFLNNTATTYHGGAIYLESLSSNVNFEILNVTAKGNTVAGDVSYGGAIWKACKGTAACKLTIKDSFIIGNKAFDGGGIAIEDETDTLSDNTIQNTEFSGNESTSKALFGTLGPALCVRDAAKITLYAADKPLFHGNISTKPKQTGVDFDGVSVYLASKRLTVH